MAQTPEGKVKDKIKKILKAKGIYYAMPHGAGYGNAGVPDFLCCVRGYFLAIEAKAKGGKPTALQVKNMDDIRNAGGVSLVVDEDVNIRDWKEVIWAITTRVDPTRDTTLVDNTPIDYLDFASPVSGLGSKMGMDATNKWPGETTREWGRTIEMDAEVKTRVDAIWQGLNLG